MSVLPSAIAERLAPRPGASVPGGEVMLPALTVSAAALENNLAVMAAYAADHGFVLAPHGKTTLAPELFRRQLAHGAWGVTTANVAQAAVAFGAGAARVLVANEIASDLELELAAELLAPGGRELFCLVDSLAGVALAEEALARHGGTAGLGGAARLGGPARLGVLVELGVPGCRTGARSSADALAVARAAAAAPHLLLSGVEGYEGVITSERTPAALAAVDAYLAELGDLAEQVLAAGLVERPEALVSAGGSKYFDRVAAVLAPVKARAGERVTIVVRSGCYLTHDHGIYDAVSPLSHADARGERLLPALELWATVLSVPEPGLALVGFGKRDAPYDAGLPVPLRRVRAGTRVVERFADASVSALDDQHAYLRFATESPVAVGDRIGFGISHPCTAFDKWRCVLLVDDAGRVEGEIATEFH